MGLKVGDTVTIHLGENDSRIKWWEAAIIGWLKENGPTQVVITRTSRTAPLFYFELNCEEDYFLEKHIGDLVTVKYMQTPLYKVMHERRN